MSSTTHAASPSATQSYFNELVDHVQTNLKGNEIFLTHFGAEDSDFVRLNRNRVRQAGHVVQRSMGLDLIDGQRQASTHLTLSGDKEVRLRPHRYCAPDAARPAAVSSGGSVPALLHGDEVE